MQNNEKEVKEKGFASFLDYQKQSKEAEQKALEEYQQLKGCVQRIFESRDGQYFAAHLIKQTGFLQKNDRIGTMSEKELFYRQAMNDFVARYIISLIKKETFIDILRQL